MIRSVVFDLGGVLIDIGIAPGFRCEDQVPRIVLQYG